MSCRARLLCAVALTAIGIQAANAQSAVAPSASATPSQIANSYSSPYGRPVSGPTAQDAANLPGQAGQPANVGPYQAVGITTDQIVWYPSVTGAAFYDDNVFARHSNRQGDWAAVVRPEMAWRTNNWANMQLAGSYFVESRSGAFSALALVETSPLLLDVLPVLVPAALRMPRLVDAMPPPELLSPVCAPGALRTVPVVVKIGTLEPLPVLVARSTAGLAGFLPPTINCPLVARSDRD